MSRWAVLGALGLQPRVVRCLKDVPLQNASLLAETRGGGQPVVRRYHAGATLGDLAYEHKVLRHLAGAGWIVPEPVGDLVEHAGLWYCPTRYVPGRPAAVDARRSSAAAAVTWAACTWRCVAWVS
jgi:Ser/Thr protein kinase RdoA (MazF antagonist)